MPVEVEARGLWGRKEWTTSVTPPLQGTVCIGSKPIESIGSDSATSAPALPEPLGRRGRLTRKSSRTDWKVLPGRLQSGLKTRRPSSDFSAFPLRASWRPSAAKTLSSTQPVRPARLSSP
eukprot:752302-Hanusia_phi.AAC.6